jgi:hypothetical protein
VANTGKTRTEEQNKATSERISGEKHPMYGIPRTEAQKKAHSERMSGENNPNFGVPGKTGALNPRSKAVIAIKPDGTESHFGGVREAARELGIPEGNLRYFLKNGKQPKKGKCEGWQFFYENSEVLI